MSDMQAQGHLSEAIPIGRRAHARARIYVPATFILLDGQFSCILEDLSFTGARIALGHRARADRCGVLNCGPLDIFCMIVWSLDAKCGLLFEEPIDLHFIQDVRTYAERYPTNERQAFERSAEEWVRGRASLFSPG